MALPKAFQNYAEFEREILRGSNRVGLSAEDILGDLADPPEDWLESFRDALKGRRDDSEDEIGLDDLG